MNAAAARANIPPAESSELDALAGAITQAIEALVTWDITAFQAACDRQQAICDRLTLDFEWRKLPATAAAAKEVRELNRVYDQLLQHSVHWTRTMQSILQAGGHTFQSRAAMHFRG